MYTIYLVPLFQIQTPFIIAHLQITVCPSTKGDKLITTPIATVNDANIKRRQIELFFIAIYLILNKFELI